MAAIHGQLTERSDFDRLRQDNTLLRDELRSLREQLESDRKAQAQVLENLQATHKEERRDLKTYEDSLVEENEQLKTKSNGFQGRPGTQNGRSFGGRLERELERIRERFESMHRDLLASNLMSNLAEGKHIVNPDDVDILKHNFKRILTELLNLNSMLTKNGGSNTLLSHGIQGPKTSGSASNACYSTSKPDDLVYFAGPVTENALLCILEDRLHSGHTITKLGPVLMSLNSFNPTYNQSPVSTDMLHLESTVKQSINKLTERGIPQVFVLSGCSGSGKTYISQVLARLILEQGDGGVESDISKHFLASVTVLHALGMSKTLLNTDSSRVGHLYEFHFTNGNVTKTKIQSYQLDTTRLIRPAVGERSYHIFYEMLFGVTQDERAKLHLQGYSFYNLNYLSECPLPSEDEENDFKAKFEKWRVGLGILGIPFPDVLRILAAILLLGNVQFVEGEGLELDVKGNNEIKVVAALLGVSGVSLYRGLTTKTKNLRGQVFRSLCEPAVANFNRDALAMSLYSRTLAAIARRVNSFKRPTSSTVTTNNSPQGMGEVSPRSGSPSGQGKTAMSNGLLSSPQGSLILSPVSSSSNSLPSITKGPTGVVTVMDMFGFESTKVNQLEELCINLCSETLQHFYNTHIFKSSEEYCREEDILNDFDVDYMDNASCIELMTCQRAGIFTLLDAETLFASGTHQSFLEKLRTEHQSSPCFYDPDPNSSCFAVSHHADNVVYDARNLLDINRDAIPDDIVCIFSRQNCNFGFASHLYTSDLKSAQGQAAVPKGVPHRISPTSGISGGYDNTQTTFSQDFQSKLDHLLKTLVQAEPTFLRCIKANHQEKPNVFDRKVVSQQLKSLQVFETLQLLQSEVAHHSRFEAFIKKYGILLARPLGGIEETGPEDCTVILESQSEAASWIIGNKYVFFSDVIKQELDRQLDKRRVSAAVRIQTVVRGWLCTKHWKNLKRSLEMQKKARHQSRTNQKHGSNRHITSSHHELSVDTKTAEQMCCLYGLDMETPPPLPKSRRYTVRGNMKFGFPQTRIMKQDLQDGDGQVLLCKGEHVKIVGPARKRGYLLVEHRGGTNIQVPFQITELKVAPHLSPR